MADTREVEVPPRPRAAQVMEVPILPGLYVRQALDIQWSDLAVSYARTLLPLAQDHAAAVADLEEFWGVEGESEGVCALSVRSFFHALLTYLDLPAGSEVIMSAVTIKDMPRIVRHHGLVPVPVDIDLATLAPRLDLLEAAVSSKVWGVLRGWVPVACLAGPVVVEVWVYRSKRLPAVHLVIRLVWWITPVIATLWSNPVALGGGDFLACVSSRDSWWWRRSLDRGPMWRPMPPLPGPTAFSSWKTAPSGLRARNRTQAALVAEFV